MNNKKTLYISTDNIELLQETHKNIECLQMNNNNISGILSLNTFPNLIQLYCGNNHITEIDWSENIHTLEELYIYDNKIYNLQPLPHNLQVLFCFLNYITKLPILPISLKRMRLYWNRYDEKVKLDIHKQSFDMKKSLVCLLNKGNSFEHNLPPYQLQCILDFKRQQRDVWRFEHAIMTNKSWDEISPENRKNKRFKQLGKMFILCNVVDFLGKTWINKSLYLI